MRLVIRYGFVTAKDYRILYEINANPALAKLEKLPLHVLIGSAFGDLFYNMDSKWLESYERPALYGEMIEILDYSPEIDTNLKVICFQTFVGHCGCILFNLDEMK